MELLTQIKEKTAEINQLKANLIKELRPTFKELFVPFLEKWEQVKFFRWTQFTPYFNDGEPCVFHVHDLYGYTGHEEEELDDEGSLRGWRDPERLENQFGDKAAEVCSEFKVLAKEFGDIPEDILKELFGDHARVTVTRDGIDVEEYSHD